jgi:catalase
MPTSKVNDPELARHLLAAFDAQSGVHPGFRPAHAKGLMCSGTFTPSPEAARLTRAPHASRPTTAVTVRYSDSTGLPTIPDNDPARSGPRGMAVRFHLAEHEHTDLIAHSTDGFPVRSGEEFLAMMHAFMAGPEVRTAFLTAHPNAKRFLEAPKPIPTSFTREAFFAVNAFKLISADGAIRHGRFRILPEAGTEYFSDEAAAKQTVDFLFDEIGPRLAAAPVALAVSVQLAAPGDDVTDASVTWPAGREELPFGRITLTARVDDQAPERRKIIFDPHPRVDGIEPSGDPLTEARADLYLLSGRRRRAVFGDGEPDPTEPVNESETRGVRI